MAAIQLNTNRHRYTSQRIAITPDPPQVGIPATISLELSNAGIQPVTVQRIEPLIARFGMGVTWEQLDPLGPFTIAPGQVERIAFQWTPGSAGHRCLRAHIFTDLLQPPLVIGRNMHVIEAASASHSLWRVPFAVGNPGDRSAPVLLTIQHDPQIQASLVIKNHVLLSGETIELAAREEVQGTLLLLADTPDALNSAIAVEAFVNGQFLDGIEVTVRKPALERRGRVADPPFVAHNDAGGVEDSLLNVSLQNR